jgi:hypothetical protein
MSTKATKIAERFVVEKRIRVSTAQKMAIVLTINRTRMYGGVSWFAFR